MAVEEQLLTTAEHILRNSGYQRNGQHFTSAKAEDRVITHISGYVKKFTQLGGTTASPAYVQVLRWSDKAVLSNMVLVQWVDTTASYVWYEAELSPSLLVAAADWADLWVGVYHQSGTVNAGLYMYYYAADVVAGSRGAWQRKDDSVWEDASTHESVFRYTWVAISTPVITTQTVTSISGTTATGNGNITTLGAPSPTAYGVCWNTTGTPTTADDKTDEGAASVTGAFTTSMTELIAGTKYYVRTYATNSEGTVYGNQVVFWADKGTVYPTDPITRVTSLIHRSDRGTYTLEVGLGEVTADFGLPEPLSKPQPSLPEEPVVPVESVPTEPAPVPPPSIVMPDIISCPICFQSMLAEDLPAHIQTAHPQLIPYEG